MPPEEFWQHFVLTKEEKVQQLNTNSHIPINRTRLATAMADLDKDLTSNLGKLKEGLNRLDDDIGDILLSLRQGKRRWRLTIEDWNLLAIQLIKLGSIDSIPQVSVDDFLL